MDPQAPNQTVPVQPSNAPPTQPPQQPSPILNKTSETRTLIAIILLFFFYPVGVIFMWLFTKWPRWVKLLISAPIILAVAGIVVVIILVTKDPLHKLNNSTRNYSKSSLPTPIDYSANWKTYTDAKYKFTIKYPPTGDVIDKDSMLVPGECGNAIKEITPPKGYAYSLVVDNFFSVLVKPWKGSLFEYLNQEKVDKSKYNIILETNADEAVGSNYSGHAFLGSTLAIYKKGDYLFFQNSLQDSGNIGGCVAQGLQLSQIEISFKFTK